MLGDEEFCAYELQRQETINANNAELRKLGIDVDREALKSSVQPKLQQKRPKKTKPTPQEPTRGSSRLREPRAKPEERRVEEREEPEEPAYHVKLKAASKARRLNPAHRAKLDALEPPRGEVTEAEAQKFAKVAEDVRNGSLPGGWRAHKEKGTSMYAQKRELLRKSAEQHKVRWPSWLGKIQAALPPMGKTATAADQTMYAIERAAVGLGLDYKNWPDGVGVLLSDVPPEADGLPLPRLLTLGSDTEMLRREGQKLEAECVCGRFECLDSFICERRKLVPAVSQSAAASTKAGGRFFVPRYGRHFAQVRE
jgi:hypothetical protein